VLRNRKPPDAEREQTDESLRVEREITDQVLGDEQDGIDELADAVITRARLQADKVLAAARDKSDRRPGPHASGALLPHVIASERAVEDRMLREERADADEILSAERAEHVALLSMERDKTDNDLLRERKRSDDALAVRDEFLGIVSHDLRNMLSSIVLSAGLIEEHAEGEHAEHVIKHAQRIRRGGARMSRLVGDLIDVASIEAGALAVTCETADAALVVAEAIETFQAQAAANDISLRAEVVGPLTAIAFDPARILQVLCNLLSNAIKFTPPGGNITVRAEHTGADLYVCVADTGAGIPADKLEVVFRRFLQLRGNDRRGLGLGLYISKCIVQGHGGRIWAESELGAGSKFCFTLPHPPPAVAQGSAPLG
jgi:signal transduction histidine kinase